jgi:transposase
VRERAVMLVAEHRHEYGSQWATVTAIAPKIGVCAQTLQNWVKQAEVGGGARSGLTTDEKTRLKELEHENKELRRANEILKAASVFFASM